MKKKFGQNFLRDDNVLNKIISCVSLAEKDLVIEIGPGHGALTKKLKQTNAQILCYEIDIETKPYLDEMENNKTTIKYGDFLKADIVDDLKKYSYDNLYVIANLPYYITTPIIQKIIDSKINPQKMLLMIQKEVAERFNAKPRTREYNSLTVYLNYYFDIKSEFGVGRNCFYPVPNVDSTVISMTRKNQEQTIKSEDKFNEFLKTAFTQKRKTLKNNLGIVLFEKVYPILEKHGYLLSVRAEEIDLNTYIEIVNFLSE